MLPRILRGLLGEMADKVLLESRNAPRKVVEAIFVAVPVQ